MADDRKPKEQQGLPEGWKWVKLGEVIEEVKEKVGNKYLEPVAIGIQGVKKRSEIYYKDLAEDYSKNKVFKSGNVAFGLGSNEMAIGVNTSNQDYCISPAYRVFELKEQDALYFHYFLSFFKKVVGDKFLILSARQGKTVDFERLFNEYIPLPPLPEQRKIAQILETVDNAIEKTEKIIEKYKRIKQGLMQDLLTKGIDEKGNIRSEKTHKFKDSPIGRIPEEWEVGYVSDFTEINPITKINPKELYPFIEMDATPIMGKQCKYITLRRGIEAGSKFKKGDILLARITPSAENGKALLVPDNIEIGIGSTEFIVFRAKENIDNNFLFYLLISDYVRSIAIGLMEGTSGRQRIPKYVFEKVIKVAIPKSKSEQKRIAEILSQIDQTIEKEEKYKQKLERLKKGLMEDLLTGKVRVNKLLEGEGHEMA
jgi:type I restriction enzyme S subunit